MKDLLLGIDIGTMGIRSMVYDTELNELGKSFMQYPLINLSDKEIEQDANLWWELTSKTIADSVRQTKGRVRALSVSSQGIAFLPVDANGLPLRNAISWLDSRAEKQLEQILDLCQQDELYSMTGKRAASFYTLPKILWLKQHEPNIYAKAHKLLLPHDYIISRLCGQFVTDHSMASGTMMYDINTQGWSDSLLASFDIDKHKLPDLCWSATVAGEVLPEVAKELGLPDGVLVCVGGQDQKCAAFGAGIDEDISTISLGTAAALQKKWRFPRKDENMKIPCFSFLFEESWTTEGVLSTAAASMRWLKENLFEDFSYAQMDALVQRKRQSKLLFYPHLAGCATPNWYKDAAGMFYGIALNTTRDDFVQALLEGIAMQLKSNLDVMEAAGELRVFGGGAKSTVWCDIIADVTGSVVKIPQTSETACLGAAMLAGMASGVFVDKTQAEQCISISRIHEPDAARHRYYQEKYALYQSIEKKLWA